jgi:hypothetical protein
MTNEPPKKITVPEGSLAKLLSDAATSPLLVEKNGELYRLERLETEGKAPSPEEVARSRDKHFLISFPTLGCILSK